MIDSARPGDMVHIPAGTYRGTAIVTTPGITLHGMGAVIDGDGAGTILVIRADDVTVYGLRIRDTGIGPVGSPSAIWVEGDRARIEDVVVEDAYIGIAIRGASDAIVEDSTVSGLRDAAVTDAGHATGETSATGSDASSGSTRGDGISLWNARNTQIIGNQIDAVRDGIYLSYGDGITLSGNHITGSRYAVHDMYALNLALEGNRFERNLAGAVLMYGGPVRLEENAFLASRSPSTGYGLLIKDADRITAVGNTIAGNRVGIHVENAGATMGGTAFLEGNTIAFNEIGVDFAPSASETTFTRNNFVENTLQVLTSDGERIPGVSWSQDGIGNYWSSYRGYDADGDGVGDMAFTDAGVVESIVGRDPDLQVFASGPGFRLLGSLENRWASAEPAISDPSPLAAPFDPAIQPVAEPGSAASLVTALAAASLLAGAAAVARARRPRAIGRVRHG
ncbi:MAG: NosD domain-containing protein [Actinomycetota bacterium]